MCVCSPSFEPSECACILCFKDVAPATYYLSLKVLFIRSTSGQVHTTEEADKYTAVSDVEFAWFVGLGS